MNKLLISILFFLSPFFGMFAQESAAVLSLKGYLGQEEMAKTTNQLEKAIQDRKKFIVLDINSKSGDLVSVIDFAKKIYSLKQSKQIQTVLAYIEENAIGPAAILPFLSDELEIGIFTSWGDVPLGSEGAIPTNILKNQVQSLIAQNHPHFSLIVLIADAMTDPSVALTEDNGLKKISPENLSGQKETLVLNQNQLKQLGLITQQLSSEQFHKLYEKLEENSKEGNEKPSFDLKFTEHIKYSESGPNFIGKIIIDDRQSGINQSTWLYVKQALEYYKTKKPIFIILELNTPGGEVFAAQKISDGLKEFDTNFNIPVVAFINNWAISAGALLAYSCRFITVVKDGTMGAAEPIIQSSTGESETASEKINSAIRADFASRAQFFDRNPYIAEAMVDKNMIVVLRHGKIVKLDQESQIRTTGPDPDIVISSKGKLLTLSAPELIRYGVADLLLEPKKVEPLSKGEEEAGKWPAKKELLFQNPFFAGIPNASIDLYKMDWRTKFFVFLATPLVSSLLFLGLLIGGYIEFNSPGLGLPGLIAGLCLFLIILSSFSLQIANWLELIFLVFGLLLILTEIFLVPTMGILGVIGGLFFLAGLFGMMIPEIGKIRWEYDSENLNIAGQYLLERIAWFCGTLLLAFAIILLLAKYVLPSFHGYQKFVLAGNEQEGYIAGDRPELLPAPGAEGEVIAVLRPAGKVIIQDKVYDAISRGNFIEKGKKIIVSHLEGSVIIVKEIEK